MLRSEHILKGLGNQYYRATYKSMGFTTEDLKRPLIGIANAWSECVPGHYNLRQVAQRVKDGIYRAGGTPIEFGVIGGCDGMGQGHDGRDDADRDDRGQRHAEALSRRDVVRVRAHDVARADRAELRHQHAHLVIACTLRHLKGDRCDRDARDVAEHADGGQDPRRERDRDQAALRAQFIHDRFRDTLGRAALDQRTGEDAGGHDTDDGGDDALRARRGDRGAPQAVEAPRAQVQEGLARPVLQARGLRL